MKGKKTNGLPVKSSKLSAADSSKSKVLNGKGDDKSRQATVQKDPSASAVYKSLFTSSDKAKKQGSAHWVTYNPFYNWETIHITLINVQSVLNKKFKILYAHMMDSVRLCKCCKDVQLELFCKMREDRIHISMQNDSNTFCITICSLFLIPLLLCRSLLRNM